jgi:hypothetical protein
MIYELRIYRCVQIWGCPKNTIMGKILLGEGRDLGNVGLMEDRRRDNS